MITGSSNSSYDLYENVTDDHNDHGHENEHEHDDHNEKEEPSKNDGYTDVYPDIDSSDHSEASNVEIENKSMEVNKEENKINYVDLDVINNNISNIKISSVEGYCKKNLGKHYKLIIFLIMIELFIFAYFMYSYMSRPKLPTVPRQVINNLSRLN